MPEAVEQEVVLPGVGYEAAELEPALRPELEQALQRELEVPGLPALTRRGPSLRLRPAARRAEPVPGRFRRAARTHPAGRHCSHSCRRAAGTRLVYRWRLAPVPVPSLRVAVGRKAVMGKGME